MTSLLATLLLASSMTVGPVESPDLVPAKFVKAQQVELTESDLAVLDAAPEVARALQIDRRRGVAKPRRGNTLYKTDDGRYIVIPAPVREETLGLAFADSGWLQKPDGPNSGWAMVTCTCEGKRGDEDPCRLEKDGDYARIVDGSPICHGPDCCEVRIIGVMSTGPGKMETVNLPG